MRKIILIYGLLLGAILGIMKILEFYFLSSRFNVEVYLVLVGLAFLVLGIVVGARVRRKQIEIRYVEKQKQSIEPPAGLELSKREKEVLKLLAGGLSNQQIADKLFVSLNTIKTHVNNIYSKLGVKRRTQAVSEARKYGLLD